MRKFIVDTHGNLSGGFDQAAAIAELFCREKKWKDILIITPVKDTAKTWPWPENETERKILCQGKGIKASFGAIMRCIGKREASTYTQANIIILGQLGINDINKMMKNLDCKILIYIPWTAKDKEIFIEMYSPETINEA